MDRSRLTRFSKSYLFASALAGVAVVALAPAGSAVAQSTSKAEDAKKQLESKRNELQDVERKTKTLQSDVEGLTAERERLQSRLIETADLVKKSEAQLTSIETRLGELDEQERILKGSLNQRNHQIAKLLSALQRMGRNPPPVLITQREDALEMVRSAMLLSAAFPELGNQAKALTVRLNELVRVMTEIRDQRDQLRTEMTRLNDGRTRLSALMEEKRVTLDERHSELKRMRTAAADISRNVKDLNELITQLDKAVKTNTGLGAYEEQQQKQTAANITPNSSSTPPSPPPNIAPNSPAALPDNQKAPLPGAAPAAPSTPAPSTSRGVNVVELSPGATLGSPGRIKPEIAFSNAIGRLPTPAQGRQVLSFGEKTQFGGQSKGIVLETRQGAQVTSPCDGWIVYAGEFRSYGQLLIINAGGGYHVLLAGLSQIDVQPGQFVLAAEPVGTMSGWSQKSQPAATNNAPVLYVEFRKDGRPVDPDPWWVAGHRKVQG